MNASELQRKLLYWGYTDLTDYLRNSPLNRYLYKQMLDYKEKFSIETPIITLFNEIYYQCVRVGFDSNPGENIHGRYLKEEEYWLKSKAAAEMVFLFVWAMFKRKRKLSFNEECFFEHLNPLVQHSDNKGLIEGILKDMQEKDIKVPDQFAPMHYPVASIPIQKTPEHNSIFRRLRRFIHRVLQPGDRYIPSGNSWLSLTDNYSHALIERYVKLYTSVDDRLALLDHIEHSCTRKQHKRHEDFFLGLRMHITSGQIVYKVVREGEEPTDWVESGMIGAQELLNPYTNELQNIAEQYKQERDELQQLSEDQKKAYDLQLARLEAKLAELKNERNQLAHQPVSKEPGKDNPKELVLTLNEVATHVKERFSKSGADEVSTMLYHMAIEHGILEEDTFKLIDGIVPAVLRRDVPQTRIDIPYAGLVNINPQEVNTRVDEKTKK